MAIHSHGALWKERGLLTLGNKDIKRAKDFKIARGSESTKQDCHNALLRTQERQFPNKLGNQSADKAARQATQGLPLFGALIPGLGLSEFKLH